VANFELAQLNIARMVAPADSPILKDFVANLDRINSLAEQTPGYVWRLQTDEGYATAVRLYGDDVIVNLSMWKDVESLFNFVYQSGHIDIMRRRKEWFERLRDAYMVLWWVPAGHRPTVAEANAKLEHLHATGPSPDAFTFKRPFAPPGATAAAQQPGFDDTCPAN